MAKASGLPQEIVRLRLLSIAGESLEVAGALRRRVQDLPVPDDALAVAGRDVARVDQGHVAPGSADHRLAPLGATNIDQVVTGSAEQDVAAAAADQDVVPRPALDVVRVPPPVETVVAAPSAHEVLAVADLDPVRTRASE